MHATLLTLAATLFLVSAASTKYYGVSTSEEIQKKAGCLSSESQLVVIRGYLSNGQVDPNLAANAAAISGATTHWAVYMRPCYPCGDPAGQASQLKDALEGYWPKMAYVYIEATDSEWDQDTTKNRNFVLALVKALGEANVYVVTSKVSFEKVLGPDCAQFSSLPLAYIGLNNEQSCKDFAGFGGWMRPTVKLYSKEQTVCKNTVDLLSSC